MTSPRADQLAWDDARLRDPHAQSDKAARVRSMFDQIAPTYELVNRRLSIGRDAYWRRRAVELAGVGPHDRVLDVACGTGDFARAFSAAGPAAVVGCDFSVGMLSQAAAHPVADIKWCRADAQALPFRDECFTVAACAFGVRNLQDLAAGLTEMRRVLRSGGRLVILEFSMPASMVFGSLYLFYLRRVLPRLATWISRDHSGAYRYLPASVSSFLDWRGMAEAFRGARFGRVEQVGLTGGVVSVHLAWKE